MVSKSIWEDELILKEFFRIMNIPENEGTIKSSPTLIDKLKDKIWLRKY